MTLLHKLSLAATIGSATFAVAASVPKTMLPDNVILCEPNAGCVNQTFYGRNYKVLTTPRFTVMVAISKEGAYTRADVSVYNKTETPLNLTPDDFRVEVVSPKPKILNYVPPANLILPAPPLPPAPPAAATVPQPPTHPGNAFVSQSTSSADTAAPAPSEIETAPTPKENLSQEEIDKAATEHHLSASSIPPNQATSGRVYFERDKHAHLVNVVLPIAGIVFEFPYAMKK
jgi:hypothetical protein